MSISKVIQSAVDSIHFAEQKKKRVSEKLFPMKKMDLELPAEFAERKLTLPVENWVPQGKIAGVDSGFVAKRLSSVDLVLIRAVGVVFEYEGGIVKNAAYYPGYFRFPEPHLSNSALEEDEAEQSKSLMRLREEVSASKKVIEKFSPKYLFIDGSIVPQYQDKPRKESRLSGDYVGIIREFESLYEIAQKNSCTLVSTVEDSRGSRFVSMLRESILKNDPMGDELANVYDSSFLDYFLSVGERSCAFTYTKNIRQHPVLQDFSQEWSNSIYALYMKPTAYDRPLRVEFIAQGDVSAAANEVARVAMSLSSLHREYAYPSILIEADLHAKLRPDEIEIVYNKIMDKLGNSVKLKMRRDNRPF
ncbi:MAG: DNA double-strand break repair nuclease NurA [archaeon]|nr:DNA double-strand break repair nuclease NurA [archaeon]